jgi:hypothetical protein
MIGLRTAQVPSDRSFVSVSLASETDQYHASKMADAGWLTVTCIAVAPPARHRRSLAGLFFGK